MTTINLKLFPILTEPPDVQDYDVPLIVLDLKHMCLDLWDKTILKLIPYLNGVFHIKRISIESQVDILLVREGIRHLK